MSIDLPDYKKEVAAKSTTSFLYPHNLLQNKRACLQIQKPLNLYYVIHSVFSLQHIRFNNTSFYSKLIFSNPVKNFAIVSN